MKILLVAATALEIDPILSDIKSLELNGNIIDSLITGVGMTATAYALGKTLALSKYDLAINAGIAGAFDRSLKIGDVVLVSSDCFAELGAEDGNDFLTLDKLGLGKSDVEGLLPFKNSFTASLQEVKSITVNKVHGNDESINSTISRLNPHIESMEGAAFFYSCNQESIPCIQLRAISNYVERRNCNNWNIPLAVNNLNDTLMDLLKKM
ncbi:futalosine hydrolase [Pedobacter sp. P351]|uniref:futalosine hydrolase n=1 Tax=Pedobacter superstes TaxID=3133441 RepID=UPI0030AECD82